MPRPAYDTSSDSDPEYTEGTEDESDASDLYSEDTDDEFDDDGDELDESGVGLPEGAISVICLDTSALAESVMAAAKSNGLCDSATSESEESEECGRRRTRYRTRRSVSRAEQHRSLEALVGVADKIRAELTPAEQNWPPVRAALREAAATARTLAGQIGVPFTEPPESDLSGASVWVCDDGDVIFDRVLECCEDDRDDSAVRDLRRTIRAARACHRKQQKRQEQAELDTNLIEFKHLLRTGAPTKDLAYFRNCMTAREQRAVLAELHRLQAPAAGAVPQRIAILQTDIPRSQKLVALQKVNALRSLEPGGDHYYKVQQWVEAFMRIPWGVRRTLPVSVKDGLGACREFLENAKARLDDVVYGLDDAKLQVMQCIGQWLANPSAMGTAIGIQGPMGTGKTTLVMDGISKILGRDTGFIALGGATDSSALEGHSYTYEGSTWGRIVDILIQCGSMNPVIFFDELDKVSETARGQEIVGILTHLTDTSQNAKFHDKYFAELEFDLSGCLFIFSYNDESLVNPILRDRMYRIETRGYSDSDKLHIARQHLLPKILSQLGFTSDDVVLPDAAVQHIIARFTGGEAGVRNLKRCLETVHSKLNLCRLCGSATDVFGKDFDVSVEFPVTVTTEMVDKLLKSSGPAPSWQHLYM